MSPGPPSRQPLGEKMVAQAYAAHFNEEGLSYCNAETARIFIEEVMERAPKPQGATLLDAFNPILELGAATPETKKLLAELAKIVNQMGLGELLVRHDKRVIGTLFADFVSSVNSPKRDSRSVVFVAHAPYFLILREAMYLRRNGHRVFLATLGQIPENLKGIFKANFDGIVDARGNFRLLRSLLAELGPDVFHVQCWMWYTVLGRLAIESKGLAAVVCEFYDITSVYAERDLLCGNWPAGVVDFDFAMERYILHHADAVITRFPADVVAEWRDRHGAMPLHIRMHAYPCPEFIDYGASKLSDGDGVTRLVYAGGLIPLDGRNPPALFPETGMPGAFRILLEQGFAIDILQDPHSPLAADDARYADYIELARKYRRLGFVEGVPPDRLAAKLAVYDYGILLFDYDPGVVRIRDSQRRGVVATKIFAYLEAGLPVLVNAEYDEMSRILNEHGIGLAVHSSELGSVAELLKGFDYQKTVDNIRRFNEQHGMDREIHRLIELYDKISA